MRILFRSCLSLFSLHKSCSSSRRPDLLLLLVVTVLLLLTIMDRRKLVGEIRNRER